MDQARTLRQLLKRQHGQIAPLFATAQSAYLKPLCQAIFESNEALGHSSLIFDGGFLLPSNPAGKDLRGALEGRSSLEDLARPLLKKQHVIPAAQGFKLSRSNPALIRRLGKMLHRLPATCDSLYATLASTDWPLATEMDCTEDWHWLVEPTAVSVTETFKAIRQLGSRPNAACHRIIVAGTIHTEQADEVFVRLQEAVSGFTEEEALQYTGHMPKIDGQAEGLRQMKQACRRLVRSMQAKQGLECV